MNQFDDEYVNEHITEEHASLTHIANCDYCAEQFANYVMEHELIRAPRSLKSSILQEAKKLTPRIMLDRVTARKQLFFYSLRVSIAAFSTILILLVSIQTSLSLNYTSSKPLDRFATQQEISKTINEFGGKLSKQLTDIFNRNK